VRVAALQNWLADLEKRHLSDLTFAEVSRALRALSSAYVERRETLASGSALDGAGKRAAFALFYGPLHFLLVDAIAHALQIHPSRGGVVVDLGCGTGAVGASLAVATSASRVIGIDRSQWALGEARRTYRAFGLTSILQPADVTRRRLPPDRATIVAAYVLNEIPDEPRDDLLARLVARAGRGDRVLIIEPIAVSVAPWWRRWEDKVRAVGGRADVWRFPVDLPAVVAKLDRAARLDHRELTGRTFWLDAPATDAQARRLR
jgi:SAM-dependent methyltransferase